MYKEPAIKWINEADPYDDDPGITIESVNADRTVYLITSEDAEVLDEWLALNYKTLFESELEDWYSDESLWPQKRNMKMFRAWFTVEYHTMIIDTVDGPLIDDEA
jgi:hypothetical protein